MMVNQRQVGGMFVLGNLIKILPKRSSHLPLFNPTPGQGKRALSETQTHYTRELLIDKMKLLNIALQSAPTKDSFKSSSKLVSL